MFARCPAFDIEVIGEIFLHADLAAFPVGFGPN
jgi:hypothetical protein